MATITTAEMQNRIGTETLSDWVEVTQGMIDTFADATGDHQFIHVDPARAAQTPFGGTIAHGFLTLSLMPLLSSKIPDAPTIEGKKLALISILRAGNGLLDGILNLIPAARVGFVGLYRDPVSLEPVQYYVKVPARLEERVTIVVDPMLATGGSMADAIRFLIDRGADDITAVTLLSAPEGIAHLQQALADVAPSITLVTGAIDERLNEVGYIVPGLGDAGDRLYGLAQ